MFKEFKFTLTGEQVEKLFEIADADKALKQLNTMVTAAFTFYMVETLEECFEDDLVDLLEDTEVTE